MGSWVWVLENVYKIVLDVFEVENKTLPLLCFRNISSFTFVECDWVWHGEWDGELGTSNRNPPRGTRRDSRALQSRSSCWTQTITPRQ